MRRIQPEAGMALPATLLIITLVTLMLATAFVRVQADRRIAESSGDLVDALAVAQSGLQTYLATTTLDACEWPIRPADGDSVRINLTGGYADVVAHVVQKPADTMATWTYIVRSTGRVIQPTQGADPQASRTVAQFAEWQRGTLTVLAAFTAANGLSSESGTGEFRGVDQAPAGCTMPNSLAIRVPAGEAPSDMSSYVLTGAPPQLLAADDGTTIANLTGIDWAATTSGGVTPDYTTIQANDTSYPVMLVTGNAFLGTAGSSTTGYGTIIVTGDLTVQGSTVQWYGVLLIGGKLRFDASSQRLDGAVIIGLNEQLGVNVPVTQLGGGYVDIDYDSRYIRRALNGFAGFVPIQTAWVDNWATY